MPITYQKHTGYGYMYYVVKNVIEKSFKNKMIHQWLVLKIHVSYFVINARYCIQCCVEDLNKILNFLN